MLLQALEHYEDLADIKRVIVHTAAFPADVRLYIHNIDTCGLIKAHSLVVGQLL